MLTKLFWALLVISLLLAFIYRDNVLSIYNNNRDVDTQNTVNDYAIPNLVLASNTVIETKDKEYIYTFIKRLENNSNEKVVSVLFDSYNDAYLKMDKGEIRINLLNDIDIVWNDYVSAINDKKLSTKMKEDRDNLLYLDLRVPNKLFYKFNIYDKGILATSTISSSTEQ